MEKDEWMRCALEIASERQDEALEQIMRRSVHSATLDLASARRALFEIYTIAKECRSEA